MPRKARIDAPGAPHHIIVRGIERRKIFLDDFDRDNFLKRLDNVLAETATPCFAWALIPNHVYLLPRTGTTAIATVMRRLLTGYAVSFNRRHRRHGQLFQNRYKSILCREAFERLIKRVAKLFDISPKELLSGGKHTKTVKARSVVCYWGNRELGMSTIELSKKLNISQPTASQSVVRGQKIARAEKLAFLD
jgi:REP element-mobilizing transposase RayT